MVSTVTIDLALLLELAGSIGIFGGAAVYIVKVIKRLVKPMTDIKDQVDKHTEYLDNDDKRLKKLEDEIEELAKAQKIMIKSQLAVLEHMETDNATGKLAESREEINEFLVNK